MKIDRRWRLVGLVCLMVVMASGVFAEETPAESVDLKELARLVSEGDGEAMYQLGVIYEEGLELPPNADRAMEWFMLAADEGHAIAQYRAGRVYLAKGNYPTAIELLGASARQGHARAQYTFGLMHEAGRGMNRSDRQAVYWYTESARQGDADAQYSLAGHYTSGKGVDEDLSIAMRWLTESAKQGHQNAQRNLAFMHIQGEGVPMNLVHGYAWFGVMADSGDFPASKLMTTLAESMNAEEIRRADNLAASFLDRITKNREEATNKQAETASKPSN
ncbi:MAG: tetratricopeptide repeat protein [Candidatus Hydrogenedentota bacterium]